MSSDDFSAFVERLFDEMLSAIRDATTSLWAPAAPSVPSQALGRRERGGRAHAWDRVRDALTAPQRATPIADVELPTRLRNFAARARLHTLGDLANRSAAELR